MNDAVTYFVPDISSGHCRAAITAEVKAVAGVDSVEVNLTDDTLAWELQPDGAYLRVARDGVSAQQALMDLYRPDKVD